MRTTAEKKISLKIAIDGEAEYKRQLRSINDEYKTFISESKKLDAMYAGNLNTYDALVSKGKLLAEQYELIGDKTELLRDALQSANSALERHRSETEALYEKQMKAQNAYDAAAEKTDELKRALDSANAEYARNRENIEYTERRIQYYTRELNKAEAEQITLGREIDNTNAYLREAAVSADGTATSIDRYGKEVKDASEDTKSFGEAANVLAQAIVASGAVQGAEKLRDAIVDTVKASIEYESAFAGVRKTVDGTAEELDAISGALRSMSLEIPMTVEGLAGIAENAGQLGIATEDVLGFTEVVAALSKTTNLTADQAAVDMSRIANITKLTSDEYSNFGSALVALGNDSAAFESEILAMTNRLAAAGSAVGATEAELLGIATTLVSVGIEAEAGGTAFSKLFRQIELAVETGSEKVQQYADVAGMSVTQFAELWRTDATGAVAAFIEGLGGLEEKGKSSIAVLNDMGITEQRLLAAVTAVSEAEGLLSKNVELSNTAWAENTALADEAAVRYETTESKLQLLKNAFNDLKITVGDELKESFGGAIDGLTDLTAAANEYVKQNPEVVSGIMAVAAALGSFAVVGTVIPLVSTLWGLLSANPAGLAAAGIIALVSAVAAFAATLPEANDDVSVLIRDLEKLSEQTEKTRSEIIGLKEAHDEQAAAITAESGEIEKAIAKVEELGNKSDITASESEILKSSIDKLNKSIPGLRLSYDDLNDSLEETVYHLRLVASAQALVDEAVTKSDLKDSLKAQGEELQSNVDSAKKALDDAQELLDAKKLLEEEFFETQSGQKNTEEALKPGETPWSPYAKDIELLEQALKDANDAYTVAVGAREANKRSIYELTADISKLDAEYAEKAKEIKEINSDLFQSTEEAANGAAQAVDTTEQAMSDTAETAAKAAEKVKTTTDTTKKAVDEAAEALKKNTKTVQESLDTLVKDYNSTYNSLKTSLEGSAGMFEPLVFESDKSVEQMKTIWKNQADYFDGYLKNLQRMVDVGFSGAVISKFSDGSKQSAGYAQNIVDNLNKIELEYGKNSEEAQTYVREINESYGSVHTNIDKLATFIAERQTDFTARKDLILLDAEELLSQLGTYTGESFDELEKAVTNVYNEVNNTLGSTKTAVEEKAPEVTEEFRQLRSDIDKQFDDMDKSGEKVTEEFVNGALTKAEKQFSRVYKTFYQMGKEAEQGAKDALEIRSPSKAAEKIVGQFADGVEVGADKNTPRVSKSFVVMIEEAEKNSRAVAAAAGTSLGQTIAENLSKSMLDGLHEAISKGQAYITGANGEKIPILPSSAIDVPEDFDREAWLESMYEAGWPRELGRQDILNLHNGGLHNPNSLTKEDWRQMGYDNVADAMEAVEEGAKRYWSGASLLEQQNENTRSQAEKALENLLGLDLKENVGEEKRKEAYEAMFGVAEITYDEAIQALNDAYMQAVKDFRASGQGFSATDLYEAILDSDAYAELSEKTGQNMADETVSGWANEITTMSVKFEKAGQNMADETVSGWTNEITTMSVKSEKAVGEMLEETEKANMEAAASVGSALGSALVRAFVSAASKISSVGVDGIKSAAGGGATINLTQNFNTPTATPSQVKFASESGIKAVLY